MKSSKEGLVEKAAGIMMAMYGPSDIRISYEEIKQELRKHSTKVLQEAINVLEGRT
jgi:hypothetical protein